MLCTAFLGFLIGSCLKTSSQLWQCHSEEGNCFKPPAKYINKAGKQLLAKQSGRKNQLRLALVAAFLSIFAVYAPLISQASAAPTVSLSISRIGPGYSWGSDMGGEFTVTATVSKDVVRVEFYLNGTLQCNDTTAPFSWTSDSNSYPLGHYNITAIVYDSSGNQGVAAIKENFVSSTGPAWLVIVILVTAFLAIPILLAYFLSKHPHFGSEKTKCPKCGYVFKRQIRNPTKLIAPENFVSSCPKCGKIFWAKAVEDTADGHRIESQPSNSSSD